MAVVPACEILKAALTAHKLTDEVTNAGEDVPCYAHVRDSCWKKRAVTNDIDSECE